MGIIVVPFRLDAWHDDEPKKRTVEFNFAPCSVMAYAMLARVAAAEVPSIWDATWCSDSSRAISPLRTSSATPSE